MLPPDKVFKIRELATAGCISSEISQQTGVAESGVRKYLRMPDEELIDLLQWLENTYRSTMSSCRRMQELGYDFGGRQIAPISTFGTSVVEYRVNDAEIPVFGIRFNRLEDEPFSEKMEKTPYRDFRVRLYGICIPTLSDLPSLYTSLLPILKILSECELQKSLPLPENE